MKLQVRTQERRRERRSSEMRRKHRASSRDHEKGQEKLKHPTQIIGNP